MVDSKGVAPGGRKLVSDLEILNQLSMDLEFGISIWKPVVMSAAIRRDDRFYFKTTEKAAFTCRGIFAKTPMNMIAAPKRKRYSRDQT